MRSAWLIQASVHYSIFHFHSVCIFADYYLISLISFPNKYSIVACLLINVMTSVLSLKFLCTCLYFGFSLVFPVILMMSFFFLIFHSHPSKLVLENSKHIFIQIKKKNPKSTNHLFLN